MDNVPRRVTLSAIAVATGYSKNSVSLALRNDARLPAATRERIQKVAKEMNYTPDATLGHLMAQLRRISPRGFQAKLALACAHRLPDAEKQHAATAEMAAGCRERGAALGYSFDTFWLHDPELKPSRWMTILRARNIKGIVIYGLGGRNHLPEQFRPVWEAFPTVTTGLRLDAPALSFSCVDHHMVMVKAMAKARELGYQRPALVLERSFDERVDGRFGAGYAAAQRYWPAAQRIPAFEDVDDMAGSLTAFRQWYERHRPDVLLTLHPILLGYCQKLGLRVPRDLGIIHCQCKEAGGGFAGFDQHTKVQAAKAVDMLVGLIHDGQTSPPEFPVATLVGPTWVDGATVRVQKPVRSKANAPVKKAQAATR